MRFVPSVLRTTIVGTALVLASPVQAFQVSFTNITNNSNVNAALGESILGLDVSANNATQVAFKFTNAGSNPLSPVITQLFFDGNPLLSSYMSFSNFGDSTGIVKFQPVKNGVLPGGNGSLINFTTDYQLNALNPRPSNGIGGGESLSLLFNLASNVNFKDVLDSLSAGALRVGIHVQAFADGGSESFITNKTTSSGTVVSSSSTGGFVGINSVGTVTSTSAPTPAPAPVTVLGSIAAISYGVLLRWKRDRNRQKPEATTLSP